MTIELRPMGVTCNLYCTYCYQEPMRDAGNIHAKYDIDKMLEEADKTGQPFHLFGGEALLIPHKDLEIFFQHGLDKFGNNGIQTNGTLIDDRHIELFKKYNVHVGISIDGWKDLNDLRTDRRNKESVEAARAMTEKTMKNIQKCVDAGLGVGIIITLHRLNGELEKLPELMGFIDWLSSIGVHNGNLHALEVDSPIVRDQYCLSEEENANAFVALAKFFDDRPHMRWRPFVDAENVVKGDKEAALCTWKQCDPFNTQAVYGIEGDGALSNCGRTNKEGIDWYKAEGQDYSRYISLYHTPQEFGGCQGCRFFIVCSGSCPGEANQGDFRNKTIHCLTQQKMLSFYENKWEAQGVTPITKSDKRVEIEEKMLAYMAEGISPSRAFVKGEQDATL